MQLYACLAKSEPKVRKIAHKNALGCKLERQYERKPVSINRPGLLGQIVEWVCKYILERRGNIAARPVSFPNAIWRTQKKAAAKAADLSQTHMYVRKRGELLTSARREALAAIDGTILAGLKGHAGFFAAAGANGGEHLALATAAVLAGVAAGFAALRLIFEATAGIELLLTSGEHELLAAFFAY